MEKNQVFMIGPQKLFNELMSCRIQEKTGIHCACLEAKYGVGELGNEAKGGQTLVLLDAQGMESDDLLERVKAMCRSLPATCSLALYNLRKDSGIETEALAMGVRGFFYEDDSCGTITKGVANIFEGEVWVSRKKMVECLLNGKSRSMRNNISSSSILSRREKDILRQLNKGATNETIAGALCISPHTVRTHIYNIFKKIHVSNRLQASLWANKNLGD